MAPQQDDGSAGDANYGAIGSGYASYRQSEPAIAAAIEHTLGPCARTVLNVGAGIGSYESLDRAMTAVEPSASMRAQRRGHLVAALDAVAESLPSRVHQAGAEETRQAIDAGHAAFRNWSEQTVSAREAVFIRAGDVIAAKANEIVEVLIAESDSVAGKSGFEVGYCLDLLRTAASELRSSSGETMPMTSPGQFSFAIRQPLGVIAGIAPFDAPFLLAMKKVVGHSRPM